VDIAFTSSDLYGNRTSAAPYPHKAILGTAYEFATGDRLGSSDFEGGKSGAVAVLRDLGFTIQEKR